MTFNSPEIIQDIRTEFEMLLDFVTSEAACTATVDQIERGLFKLLLQLGAKLLHLFFVMRAQACSREPLRLEGGQELAYDSDKKRTYFSVFGELAFWRPYFYKKGGAWAKSARCRVGSGLRPLLRPVAGDERIPGGLCHL